MSEKIKYEILAVVILILAIGLLVAQYMNSIEKIGIKPFPHIRKSLKTT